MVDYFKLYYVYCLNYEDANEIYISSKINEIAS